MDHAVLVDRDSLYVLRLKEKLDADHLPVQVIALVRFEEYADTRLVLAARSFEEHDTFFNYMQFGQILRDLSGFEDQPLLLLMKMDDPFITALRQMFGHVEETNGRRLSVMSLGDRYVEGGFLYRCL